MSYLRLHQDGISSFQKQVMTPSAQGSGEEEPSPEPRPSPSPHPQNLQVRLGIEKTLCGRSIFKLMTAVCLGRLQYDYGDIHDNVLEK